MVDTNFEESQRLSPDGEVILFEIVTRTGTSVFLKSGPPITYLGDTYESVPISISSEKRTAEEGNERPNLTIGGDDLDFNSLKPALFSGQLDGGNVTKHIVELDDLLNNRNIKISMSYRIKQVQSYNRFKINLILARFSPSSQTTIPYRKYMRPAFPHVQL